jgi:hypothetical protein
MTQTQEDSRTPPGDKENLLAAYQAACNRHQQIDEFRGKLLALLPTVSGAGGLVLLKYSGTFKNYLTPIGIYGFAATFGIFIYELYGISVCKRIIEQAGDLESQLGIPREMGQYRDRKRDSALHKFFEAEMASWVVYIVVLAGWLYIATANTGCHLAWHWLIVCLAASVLAYRGYTIVTVKGNRLWNFPWRNNKATNSDGEEIAADIATRV